jgi:UDP-N-acetylglucosamine 2-epimerase (non-hydrolysing)
MKIISVVGARPNFMKVAPLHRAFQARDAIEESLIVHTGQHYDEKMSDIFFEQLELPHPDRYLGVGSASHAQQTARVMTAFEEVVKEEDPDLVLVVGDVNSTLACSLVATKMHVPVAHVEAGLRSGDRDMPEEVNRLLTDTIGEFLFVTEKDGVENLKAEGVTADRIFFVGNVMIDSLVFFQEKATETGILEELNLTPSNYAVMTMHRPSTVDNREGLTRLLETIERVAALVPLVFPMHPRTRNRFDEFGLADRLKAIDDFHLLEPLGYLEFLRLMEEAGVVITDSGGIQEETTFLQVPCLTLRDSTERPITITQGTNELMDLEPKKVGQRVREILSGDRLEGNIPEKWDGKAAERIAKHIENKLAVASA